MSEVGCCMNYPRTLLAALVSLSAVMSAPAAQTLAYVGTYTTVVGHPAAVVGAFTPLGLPSELLTGMAVVDVSQIAARRPGGRIVQLGAIRGGDQHTETFARIGGQHYDKAAADLANSRTADLFKRTLG